MTTPLESQREVILCLLAGKSINRAANETGVPKGTISRLCKKQSFIDLMEQIKAENSKPKSQPKSAAKPVDRPAVSVAVEVVDLQGPGGRSSLLSELSDEKRNEFLKIIRDYAVSVKVAACAVGLVGDTVQEWVRRGEGRDGRGRPATPEYAEFAAAVRRAEAECQLHLASPIVTSARTALEKRKPENIDDAKWLLQRRFNEEWGPTQKLDVQFEAKLTERVGEHLTSIYAAIAATDRIPEEFKVVFYEVVAGVSGDGGELVEGV